jgi:phenylacetaldehyde dehydrogenase
MTITIQKPAVSAKAAKFLTKELKLFIDGKWVAAKSVKTFPVEDPATKETIANAPAGEEADIDLAVAAARRAFETGDPSDGLHQLRAHRRRRGSYRWKGFERAGLFR